MKGVYYEAAHYVIFSILLLAYFLGIMLSMSWIYGLPQMQERTLQAHIVKQAELQFYMF
jgi:hypothetical protein